LTLSFRFAIKLPFYGSFFVSEIIKKYTTGAFFDKFGKEIAHQFFHANSAYEIASKMSDSQKEAIGFLWFESALTKERAKLFELNAENLGKLRSYLLLQKGFTDDLTPHNLLILNYLLDVYIECLWHHKDAPSVVQGEIEGELQKVRAVSAVFALKYVTEMTDIIIKKYKAKTATFADLMSLDVGFQLAAKLNSESVNSNELLLNKWSIFQKFARSIDTVFPMKTTCEFLPD